MLLDVFVLYVASLSMYESSSDSDEEVDNGAITTGAKILSKPSKAAIAKAFEDTIPSSGGDGTVKEKTKKKSKWDVTDVESSSRKESHSSSKSKSSSHHSSSSSSDRSRRRRSSSRDRERSSSSKSSSRSSSSSHHRSSSSRSSSSRSSHHRSRSPSSRSSRSSLSKSSSSSSSSSSASGTKSVTIGKVEAVPTDTSASLVPLSERWAGGVRETAEDNSQDAASKTPGQESTIR